MKKLFIVAVLLFVISCSKDEVETYNEEERVEGRVVDLGEVTTTLDYFSGKWQVIEQVSSDGLVDYTITCKGGEVPTYTFNPDIGRVNADLFIGSSKSIVDCTKASLDFDFNYDYSNKILSYSTGDNSTSSYLLRVISNTDNEFAVIYIGGNLDKHNTVKDHITVYQKVNE